MGELFVRALPVVLLTVVVFFNNTYAWLLAATIGRGRLWLIALAFLVARDGRLPRLGQSFARAKPMLGNRPAAPRSRARSDRYAFRGDTRPAGQRCR